MQHTDRAPGADQAAPLPTFVTVEQMSRLEPALGKGAIRDDLFRRKDNGLEASGAVIYRGRRILLHRERYLTWVARRGASPMVAV
jgi:hypothetical protein